MSRSTLVLLRHGESEWNKANLFTGWVDVDLTDLGREQAVRAGRACRPAGSPLMCCTPRSSGVPFERRNLRSAKWADRGFQSVAIGV